MQQGHEKILIVAPAWVGDLVMAQALFKILKLRNPDVIIHVLALTHMRPLLLRMPEIDQVIIFPFQHGELSLFKRYSFGKKLRNKGYTEAIILPNSFKSALIPFWARIPKRTGWLGEMRYGLLNNIKKSPHLFERMVERFAVLGSDAGARLPESLWPELTVKTSTLTETLQKFDLTKQEKPVLALCPGAEYGPAKRWPAEYFAAVAKTKLQLGWQVWIFGGVKDQLIAKKIQELTKNNCIDFCGKTDLGEAADLLSLAQVVVTNDTGLMHVAAALKRRIIAIYGSSSPKFTPPLAADVTILSINLPCSPCFKRACPYGHTKCLYGIMPREVIEQI
ncbi:MAG: lipopolysaccharide heptosyltransferase II [Gammaproteobacteria bacterium]|nr:lipopolysaccharide heptosyltransferase II [Gammaproteobacteria bacterium]